jgi:hypothetical protein
VRSVAELPALRKTLAETRRQRNKKIRYGLHTNLTGQ